jgi:hypothetical protein
LLGLTKSLLVRQDLANFAYWPGLPEAMQEAFNDGKLATRKLFESRD